jgi:hypothetical protein
MCWSQAAFRFDDDLRRAVLGGDTAQLLLAVVYVLVAKEEKGTASTALDVLDIGRRHVKLCVLLLYPVACGVTWPGDGVPLSFPLHAAAELCSLAF